MRPRTALLLFHSGLASSRLDQSWVANESEESERKKKEKEDFRGSNENQSAYLEICVSLHKHTEFFLQLLFQRFSFSTL
jgi:hypothetical protein